MAKVTYVSNEKPELEKVTIGPYTYKIIAVHDLRSPTGNQLYGQIDYGNLAIKVDERYIDTPHFPVTVWHEVIHAILTDAALHDVEERVVEVLGNRLVEVIRENPDLVYLALNRKGE